MAHEVTAKLQTSIVVNKDLEIEIKAVKSGQADKTKRTSKLGKLLISKGNIEWLPTKNSANKKRLSWNRFAALMEESGKSVKVKK